MVCGEVPSCQKCLNLCVGGGVTQPRESASQVHVEGVVGESLVVKNWELIYGFGPIPTFDALYFTVRNKSYVCQRTQHFVEPLN